MKLSLEEAYKRAAARPLILEQKNEEIWTLLAGPPMGLTVAISTSLYNERSTVANMVLLRHAYNNFAEAVALLKETVDCRLEWGEQRLKLAEAIKRFEEVELP